MGYMAIHVMGRWQHLLLSRNQIPISLGCIFFIKPYILHKIRKLSNYSFFIWQYNGNPMCFTQIEATLSYLRITHTKKNLIFFP